MLQSIDKKLKGSKIYICVTCSFIKIGQFCFSRWPLLFTNSCFFQWFECSLTFIKCSWSIIWIRLHVDYTIYLLFRFYIQSILFRISLRNRSVLSGELNAVAKYHENFLVEKNKTMTIISIALLLLFQLWRLVCRIVCTSHGGKNFSTVW